jgi:hypothetical protein
VAKAVRLEGFDQGCPSSSTPSGYSTRNFTSAPHLGGGSIPSA